ncbi:MAG: hypothetical protein HYX32_11675 [Actinobacteria bacterium]|nr:hypothetical protein [Actinomycetota bacterium]
MSPGLRATMFVVGLLIVFAAAVGIGRLVSSVRASPAAPAAEPASNR